MSEEVAEKVTMASELAGVLRAELIGPGGKVGSKLPPVRTLARNYGVSPLTASKAIQELLDQGWVRKRQGSGIYIAKVPEGTLSSESKIRQKTRRVGWLVSEMGLFIPQLVMVGVSKVLHRINYKIEVALHHNDIIQEKEALYTMRDEGVEGVIMYGSSMRQRHQEYLDKELRDFPIIITDDYFASMKRPHVVMDNFQAGREITEYLVQQGCSKIAFLKFVDGYFHKTVEDRIEGYRLALSERGLLDDYECVMKFDPNVDAAVPSSLFCTLEALFSDNPPDAVISINDFFVPEIISFAENYGLSFPADLKVAGFDNIYHNDVEYHWPTVKPDFERMGERAAELLINLIETGDLQNTSGLVLSCPVITHEESQRGLMQDRQRKISALVGEKCNRKNAVV